MANCKLLKEVVKSEDGETTFTNFYLKFDGIDKAIQIKTAFKGSKSDFVLLLNLAEKK